MIRSNGLIVVIGGVSKGSLVPMSEIWVFDTNSGVWSVQTATGATPPLRRSHVAAATSTGRIYIHGGTDLEGSNYFADVAILDTTSWSWNQPPIEGSAPTGRYSHAAAMVGTNMVVTFGLTAGGATNTIFILDTTSNTWVPSYVPNNIAQTSTNPEDWPGYKPPPNIPGIPPPKETTPDTPHHSGSISPVVPIIGGIVGAVALAALVVILVRRRRRYNHKRWIERQRQLSAALYGLESDEPHMNRGAAFMSRGSRIVEPAPSSFGQRVDQLRDSLSGIAFWKRDRRAVNRSQSHRLPDRDDDLEGRRDYDTDPPYPTDQEIFMDAVHRARSRTGVLSPNFSPLQLPLGEARSPRISVTSIGGSSSGGMTRIGEEEEEPHGRAYSDGFENVMLEMDVQMVSVPRGRLYVVNPSDEALDQGPGDVDLADEAYRQFDSQRPRQDP
ncbi:hypothetical protein BGW38_006796 [Lunasporangiospora selenospora]|uniref:Galactose oxidase n=1 Tax=Lunasporangiospora selenospora TaxID=979761 RepID=A0A9P6FLF7_9FUNG|nr:hypothetical protein BGW38_006796 [Lunasporangiospora selenospora]